jgi:type II secretory ATPase GspE/PulE/Tfp pilus assembly ATPase PilB-like protein
MENPGDTTALDDLAILTGLGVNAKLALKDQLEQAIGRVYRQIQEPEQPPTQTRQKQSETAPGLEDLIQSASTVDLVASIVRGAVHSEATDIHLEPQRSGMRVRYRIDGMLYDVMTIPPAAEAMLVSRVKIMADMDITERRLPQDGHFHLELGDRTYDMRVATMPVSLGERLVIRLLNPDMVFLGLKQLGLTEENYDKLEDMIAEANGMVLVTGPIASGKTTTQYAALNKVNVLTDSIVTIEDPIEYELPGINQVQVDPGIGRSFAFLLRAVLRQDVNTLLVGEIRDAETAAIATRAAITGHLVFSTLHTKDAASAVTALLNLGIEPFLISSALSGIVNQRLVRRVCPQCMEEYQPSAAELKSIRWPDSDNPPVFAQAVGCKACYHTGYHGRTGVFEILAATADIRERIMAQAPAEEIAKAAVAGGMKTLRDDAFLKLGKKLTTVEEVMRTIHEPV